MKPPLGSLRPEFRHLNRRYTVRDTDQIAAWFVGGWSVRAISRELSVSGDEVAGILRSVLRDETINADSRGRTA
jgi:hypothetical protein